MKTILITGGAGFIGSHTSVNLLQQGFNVCIVDSLINSSEKVIFKIKEIINTKSFKNAGRLYFRNGDIRNKTFLISIFNEFKVKRKEIESVIHFAGLKSVEDSINEPLQYWDLNINSTISLLEVMNSFGCYSLVFSSSATIYRSNEEVRLKEDFVKAPINPYGNSKLTIENILKDLYTSNPTKWKIVILRYFNPAGAHESNLIGESLNNNSKNLFPFILKVAKGNYSELSIFGKDWPTKDGTCIRDYIHIMDLADAHRAALEYLNHNNSQIISLNIGTGKGTSVLEIVNKFMEVNKVLIPYTFKDRRRGDPSSLIADNTLALNLLNWQPKRDVNEMCSDSWNWVNSSSCF